MRDYYHYCYHSKVCEMRDLGLNKKFILLKIPADQRYCERLAGISKRERPGTLLSRYKIYNKQY